MYGDNWIPGDHGGRVISAFSALPTNALVSDLIDPVTGWWNSSCIEASLILEVFFFFFCKYWILYGHRNILVMFFLKNY